MPLTSDAVLDAACSLLDTFGLADLTMRRLGDELGVRAGAVYHHVPNKQTLLARVADRIIADVDAPGESWHEALAAWASNLRHALLAHRDSADLVASVRAMGLGQRDAAAPATAVLIRMRLDADAARAAGAAVLHFVLGHVAEEQARREWERFGKPTPDSAPEAPTGSFDLGVALLLAGMRQRFDLP